MGRIKKVNERQFKSLSHDKQIKELTKLTKRANVRIKLLEENEENTNALREVKTFFKNIGSKTNRFYQGVKYKSSTEVRETFEAVADFLNNESSMMSGIKKNIHSEIDRMVKQNNIDTQRILSWSEKEKIYASQRLSTIANKRMEELEKNGIKQYAYQHAEKYLQQQGRTNNRFYRGSKFAMGELRKEIEEKAYFIEAKTSTPEGYNESITKRINTFRKNGVNIPEGFENSFMDFISSSEFSAMKKYNASDQIIETLDFARDSGIEIDIINREFRKFMDGQTHTLDRVKEELQIIADKRFLRRGEGTGEHKIAPWMSKKGWLR